MQQRYIRLPKSYVDSQRALGVLLPDALPVQGEWNEDETAPFADALAVPLDGEDSVFADLAGAAVRADAAPGAMYDDPYEPEEEALDGEDAEDSGADDEKDASDEDAAPTQKHGAGAGVRAGGVGTSVSCMKQITSACLRAEGRAYVSALTMLGAGAVKAALTALTVRVFGAGGGAIATAAAYALSFAADAYFARKSLKRVSVPTFLKCSLAVAAGCFGGIAARFLPVEGALPVAIVCGSVFCLTTLLVLVITDTFGLAGKIATKAKIFGALFFNKTKKY